MTMFAGIIKAKLAQIAAEPQLDPVDKIENQEAITNTIAGEINWARQTLRRDDRIIWYLRWYRILWLGDQAQKMKAIKDIVGPDQLPNSKILMWDQNQFLSNLKRPLTHFSGLQFPEIQQYQFARETPEQLLANLRRIEATAQERARLEAAENAQLLDPEDGDEVLIQFQDGWAWWLLDRGYCSAEAKAMGHCGNVGAVAGSRLLSLRKSSPKQARPNAARPSLTFVLDEDGYLGEMKGRSNDKPAPQYHPYIIKLLEHPIVIGIRGGGYAPERNFKMTDLTDEEQMRLMEMKPGLATVGYMYAKHGVTKELISKIESVLKQTGHFDGGWVPDRNVFAVETFKNVGAMIDEYGNEFFKRVARHFDGGGDDELQWEYDISDSEARDFFSSLDEPTKDVIVQYAYDTYTSEFSEPDVDEDEAFDVLRSEGDEIIDRLKWAVAEGYRIGAEADAYKDFVKSLRNGPDGDGIVVRPEYTEYVDPQGKNHIQFDEKCWLVLDLKTAIQLCDNQGELEVIADNGWFLGERDAWKIEEPYNGWSGYDESAAREWFIDQAYEVLGARLDAVRHTATGQPQQPTA